MNTEQEATPVETDTGLYETLLSRVDSVMDRSEYSYIKVECTTTNGITAVVGASILLKDGRWLFSDRYDLTEIISELWPLVLYLTPVQVQSRAIEVCFDKVFGPLCIYTRRREYNVRNI